ncbi:MAG: hypothetical protein IPP07_17485 [Holophagales bacterium]|nr:hypothetical protein [Holophagales bacterium]
MARLDFSPALFQVAPASVERKTPSPKPALLRSVASPEPTQITRGSEGATATAPIEKTRSSFISGEKVVPAFVVFQRPPVACPR